MSKLNTSIVITTNGMSIVTNIVDPPKIPKRVRFSGKVDYIPPRATSPTRATGPPRATAELVGNSLGMEYQVYQINRLIQESGIKGERLTVEQYSDPQSPWQLLTYSDTVDMEEGCNQNAEVFVVAPGEGTTSEQQETTATGTPHKMEMYQRGQRLEEKDEDLDEDVLAKDDRPPWEVIECCWGSMVGDGGKLDGHVLGYFLVLVTGGVVKGILLSYCRGVKESDDGERLVVPIVYGEEEVCSLKNVKHAVALQEVIYAHLAKGRRVYVDADDTIKTLELKDGYEKDRDGQNVREARTRTAVEQGLAAWRRQVERGRVEDPDNDDIVDDHEDDAEPAREGNVDVDDGEEGDNVDDHEDNAIQFEGDDVN
ncbi:hypothetical protein FOL46_002341, partial [Perkinsus olseni]